MKIERLDQMVSGWLVGNFTPSVHQTEAFEFAVKHYRTGHYEAWHYHKIATEITVIVEGTAKMNDRTLMAGDIVILAPGEGVDFLAVTDVVTSIVKVPGVLNDKYTEKS